MGYKKIKATEVPKRRRPAVSRFEKTEEWQLMKKDLDKGLKTNEALEIILTDEEKKRHKLTHRRTVTRFIKKYLQAHDMQYLFKSFSRDGSDYFLVMCVPKKS